MAKLSALNKETAGINSGAERLSKLVKLSDIKLSSDFESLFAINPTVLAEVVCRIKKYGYDTSQPVHIWKEKNILIDGHTRRVAALECGMFDIPAYEHSFKSVEDALEYTLGLQTARRNLSDAEIVRAIVKLDQLKKQGQTGVNQVEKGKSAKHIANMLGTSTTKVERARAIEKKADNKVKGAVAKGNLSIYAGYQTICKQTKIKRSKDEPFFYLSEILDILSRHKFYSIAFTLLEELQVDIEIQQVFVKTLPTNIKKSFEFEVRKINA